MRALLAVILLLSLSTCGTPAVAETGLASVYWIGDGSQNGTRTASGIPLNNNALTAAHKTLPLRSRAKVTSARNGKSIVVVITDRGPFVRGRIIDLTRAGARALGFSGLAPVRVERIGK